MHQRNPLMDLREVDFIVSQHGWRWELLDNDS
jgi:hypothetical protein